MLKIKNNLFQPVMVLLAAGETLYLQSREEREIEKSVLKADHLQAMMKSGTITVLENEQSKSEKPTAVKEREKTNSDAIAKASVTR